MEKFERDHPLYGGDKCRWGGLKFANSTKNGTRKWYKIDVSFLLTRSSAIAEGLLEALLKSFNYKTSALERVPDLSCGIICVIYV